MNTIYNMGLAMEIQNAIEKIMQRHAESDDDFTVNVGWYGENMSALMAKAAMAVLEGSQDVQEMIRMNDES